MLRLLARLIAIYSGAGRPERAFLLCSEPLGAGGLWEVVTVSFSLHNGRQIEMPVQFLMQIVDEKHGGALGVFADECTALGPTGRADYELAVAVAFGPDFLALFRAWRRWHELE
jgi:hypothetical protein